MLVEVGKAEGRQPGQIIKEAIAEWLRARGWLTLTVNPNLVCVEEAIATF